MSSIHWKPNMDGSETIGTDLQRLGEYYFELSDAASSDDQTLTLWSTGSNPPLLVWHLAGDATVLAEDIADTLSRYGLDDAIANQRFPVPPDHQ